MGRHNPQKWLSFRSAPTIIGLLASSSALAAANDVELTYRLQPSRDVITDTLIEGVTTLRVLEDRGVVAKSGGRVSLLPTTITMKRKQSFRHVSGELAPDGSFSADMRFLDQRTSVVGPDGRENVLPEKPALNGLSVLAVIENDGSIRPGSVQLRGVEPSVSEQFLPIMQSALAQAAAIPSILLRHEQPVVQQMQMQVPVPGLASFDIRMIVANRLLGVEDGVATIQQIYTMDFGSAPSGTKMKADGSGGGSIRYDIQAKTVLSGDSSTLMRMTLETVEGIVEVRMNSKQTQQTRPTPPDAR